jgi:hypothetical protein
MRDSMPQFRAKVLDCSLHAQADWLHCFPFCPALQYDFSDA